MHTTLIAYIQAYSVTPLTDKDIALIQEVVTPRKFKKRQFFLQEGEICKYYGFIVQGAVRQYTIDEKGTENVVCLAIENWWTGDRDSYFREQPSVYNIEAWEETDMLLIHRDNMDSLLTIPAFVEMRLKLDDNHSVAAQKRLLSYISMNAEKRYESLIETYPQFLERFPLHVIASYLGITKESLSRIRHQSSKR